MSPRVAKFEVRAARSLDWLERKGSEHSVRVYEQGEAIKLAERYVTAEYAKGAEMSEPWGYAQVLFFKSDSYRGEVIHEVDRPNQEIGVVVGRCDTERAAANLMDRYAHAHPKHKYVARRIGRSDFERRPFAVLLVLNEAVAEHALACTLETYFMRTLP